MARPTTSTWRPAMAQLAHVADSHALSLACDVRLVKKLMAQHI